MRRFIETVKDLLTLLIVYDGAWHIVHFVVERFTDKMEFVLGVPFMLALFISVLVMVHIQAMPNRERN